VYLKMKFLPHLPLPTFEGQMNLMKIMISGAINGEVVVFGNFQLFFYKANTNSFVFIICFWNVVYLVLESYKTNFLLISVFLFSTDVKNGHEKKDLDTSAS
jgi:hypothetical protein